MFYFFSNLSCLDISSFNISPEFDIFNQIDNISKIDRILVNNNSYNYYINRGNKKFRVEIKNSTNKCK